MKEQHYKIELFGKPIDIILLDTGDGFNVLITGGDRPHIGAISVKCPGKDLVTREFPEHRDSVVSDRWACALSERLNIPVVVTAGIHYDGITKAQIGEILSSLEELMNALPSNRG